jgi:hypothetical protein
MPDRRKPKRPGLSEEPAPAPESSKPTRKSAGMVRLRRSIRKGIEQLDRGEGLPASEVIARLRARRG